MNVNKKIKFNIKRGIILLELLFIPLLHKRKKGKKKNLPKYMLVV